MDEQGIPQWDEVYPNRDVLYEDIAHEELYLCRIEGKIACVFVLSEHCDEEYAAGSWRSPESRFCVLTVTAATGFSAPKVARALWII